jgi:sister-chromatid-cohesion protein PDS5
MKILEKEVPSVVHTMQIFLRKASLWLINTSSIPTLLDIVGGVSASRSPSKSPGKTPKKSNGSSDKDDVDSKMINRAKKVLSYISKYCAQLYYPHLSGLAKDVHANSTPASLEAALRALASVACLGTDQAPSDRCAPSFMIDINVDSFS